MSVEVWPKRVAMHPSTHLAPDDAGTERKPLEAMWFGGEDVASLEYYFRKTVRLVWYLGDCRL